MDLDITVSGHNESDLKDALQQILRSIESGGLSGTDSNDTGSYHFQITGEPVEHDEDSEAREV